MGDLSQLAKVAFVLVASLLASNTADALPQTSNDNLIWDLTLAQSSFLKVPAIVDNATQTAVLPLQPGTDRSSLTPLFSTAPGVTASPPSGSTLDFTEPQIYSLSSYGSTRSKWVISAVEMHSPSLPGLYADPNIAAFDETYYIYCTTDGFPSWGGQTFYVWKSNDLMNWDRSAEPILTLNGTNGNVPWADGNAWAPTIVERYGNYYLYFSGNNPTYDRKTIGAAVSNSPEGPFTANPTAMILNNEAINTSQAIDPAAFTDPKTGVHYLFWGNGGALYAELADDMTSLKPGTSKAITGLTNFTEASFVVYRDPYYHYTYSVGNTGDASYYVGYATAENINGPWTYRGVLLEQRPAKGILATGSNSVLNVPGTDDWYIAYHRFHIPGGDGTHRETTMDRLHFDSEGIMQPVVPTLKGISTGHRI